MVNKLVNVKGNYKKVHDSCYLNSVRCWSTARPICVSIMQHISEKMVRFPVLQKHFLAIR